MSDRVQFEGNSVAAPPGGDVSAELRLLTAATGGTVMVFGWSGDAVQCRRREDPPPQPLVIPQLDCTALLPGTEAPLHVLLAWLPPDVLDRRLGGLDRAPFAVRNRALLALRLARVRTTGHDVLVGGVRGEVTSIAAPVRDGDGEVTAALALIAPSVYLEDLDLRTIATDLVRLSTGLVGAPPLASSTS
ncbi:DNA-binding IclR family transcriptional regulator [Geodermatophilus bullaregiensis]|uniref:IclR family transcriptional regulator domain-containing protein n=1 Tax=Geodermatophilus bullaregiensis TaxID=1564160 RepID=UPI001957DA14|nr:IclR family transcriptional regulator C-terminal domain-containing protein [Geodermatophilus bullaregiensis]MBM7806967.1 DNA-binding IclR family transcriptional regulator [Geodermatophilus bullaregiensis]